QVPGLIPQHSQLKDRWLVERRCRKVLEDIVVILSGGLRIIQKRRQEIRFQGKRFGFDCCGLSKVKRGVQVLNSVEVLADVGVIVRLVDMKASDRVRRQHLRESRST